MMAWRRTSLVLAISLIMPLVSGCRSLAPDLIGLASGGTAGALTANPAIGYAVGISSQALADASLNYATRRRQGAEQEAISLVAGALEVGQSGPWNIAHTIPIGNEHGTVHVVREVATPLTTCKEVIFTVDDGDGPQPPDRTLYTTQVCSQGAGWSWALAEPATPRWEYLQ